MKYLLLVFAFLLIGCEDFSKLNRSQSPVYIPITCNNLICFPDFISRVGPDFKTREECERYIDGKTNPSKMEFVYCRED